MSKAMYAGTFDPLTYGHLDILLRACELFDEVIVAVAEDNNKKTLFSLGERIQLINEATNNLPNVSVKGYTGLTTEFAKKCDAHTIVRGLRAIADFEYELQMALMNKELAPDIETVFLMTQSKFLFISSSAIKQIASMGTDLSAFVPPHVEKALLHKYFKYEKQPQQFARFANNF
ncbi:MAG: pantetheine-phosphate adenylyltransferase [Desulfitobacteriia bacterium]